MFSKLFHKDVFLPEGIEEVCKNYQKSLSVYFLSRHLQEHIDNQDSENRSHTYLSNIIEKCLESLKTEQRNVFEVELSKDFKCFGISGWVVTKYCCRIPYDNYQDLVVAIRPKYLNGKVMSNMIVTAWMNSNTDHHYTLDETKYCSEEEWKSLQK